MDGLFQNFLHFWIFSISTLVNSLKRVLGMPLPTNMLCLLLHRKSNIFVECDLISSVVFVAPLHTPKLNVSKRRNVFYTSMPLLTNMFVFCSIGFAIFKCCFRGPPSTPNSMLRHLDVNRKRCQEIARCNAYFALPCCFNIEAGGTGTLKPGDRGLSRGNENLS